MARTMKWPPLLRHGRVVWTETPTEAVEQLVRLAVTGGTGGNPFDEQEESLEAFAALTASGDLADRAIVEARFRELTEQNRAQLQELEVRRDPVSGERLIFVGYVNLETRLRERLEVPIHG